MDYRKRLTGLNNLYSDEDIDPQDPFGRSRQERAPVTAQTGANPDLQARPWASREIPELTGPDARGGLLMPWDKQATDPNRKSFWGGVIDSISEAVTTPRDVYEGKLDLNTEEGTRRVLGASLFGTSGGIAGTGAEPGVALTAGMARRRATAMSADDIAAAVARAEAGPGGRAAATQQLSETYQPSGAWKGTGAPKQPMGENVPAQGPVYQPQPPPPSNVLPGPGEPRFGTPPQVRKERVLQDVDREKIKEFIAPMTAVHTRGDAPLVERIMGARKEAGFEGWGRATEPVFDVRPETYDLTTKLVPQDASFWDRVPQPRPGEPLPLGGRSQQVIDANEQIAGRIADQIRPMIERGDEVLKFYHTGPVLQGLIDRGMSPAQANEFMGDWSGQGAATSPRTKTPSNLANASVLEFANAQGHPFTTQQHKERGTIPGYPMMGMHTSLGDLFRGNNVNPNVNPKPFVFRENWRGNLPGVTSDTHAIRGALAHLDDLYPGQLDPRWFAGGVGGKGYRDYITAGKLPEKLAETPFQDTLGSVTRNKQSRQTEYGVMAQPYMRAAEMLGVPGSTVQAGGWFAQGKRTGLMSPPLTIPNLLNDQIEATARATGLNPEDIVKLWMKRRIPLAKNEAGPAATTGVG